MTSDYKRGGTDARKAIYRLLRSEVARYTSYGENDSAPAVVAALNTVISSIQKGIKISNAKRGGFGRK